MEKRRCPRCPEPKPITEFWRNRANTSNDGYYRYCRTHASEIHQNWRRNNPEKVRLIMQRHCAKRMEAKVAKRLAEAA
jgi:hypothetical protein